MAAERATEHLSMARHPDIVALRDQYARTNETMLARSVEGLAFLAGTYAAISPWVVGFSSQSSLAVSNLIVGGAVALLAFGLAAAYEHTHGMAAVSALLGIWLIVSPWAVSGVDRTTSVLVSNIIVGAVILVLGIAATGMGMGMARSRRDTSSDGTPSHLR